MDSIPPSSEACFGQLTHYAGFDWAKDRHQIAVVDREGRLLLELNFEDTAEGWADLRQKLRSFSKLGVAIETCCGPAVERLLEAGLSVYPLNPKAAQRYRDRKNVAGNKTDRLDAWSFGDALRTDGHGWRALSPEDQKVNDAVLALMALGFKQLEAHDAVRKAQAGLGAQATVEDLVRSCLKKGA